MPLTKTHEDPALAGHILDPKSRAAAIMPLRTRQRLQPFTRFDAGDTLQIVPQRRKLDRPLFLDADVLQYASAAAPEGLDRLTVISEFVDVAMTYPTTFPRLRIPTSPALPSAYSNDHWEI